MMLSTTTRISLKCQYAVIAFLAISLFRLFLDHLCSFCAIYLFGQFGHYYRLRRLRLFVCN